MFHAFYDIMNMVTLVLKSVTTRENMLNIWLHVRNLQCSIDKQKHNAGPRSAVGNVSGYRCVSDCRSRGREFDPGPVPYFRGD